MTKQDQHPTTTQLSALLDGQLTPEEQEQCNIHLKTCEQCQHVLADLRQTVALLRAMPQPPLPRSFVLPTKTSAVELSTSPIRSIPPLHARPKTRSKGWAAYIRGAVNVTSTLAAVVGIVFLLSAFLATGTPGGTSSSSSGGAVPSSKSTPIDRAPHLQRTEQARGDTTETPTPASTPEAITPHVQPGQRQANETPSSTQTPSVIGILLDINRPSSRAIIGMILVLLGIVGFMVVRGRRLRAP